MSSHDIFLIFFLAFLEGILSIDNALVLAILARGLPVHQQRKALTYGLGGAIIFRLLSLLIVTQLIHWTWVKFVGGAYLIFVALKHFFIGVESAKTTSPVHYSFWKTVLVIELTDIAFAVDSILAAVALTPKFWIVFTGGMLGVVMMRFAATMFISLLRKFPHLEVTAYLLILVIGIKVILEGLKLPGVDFHNAAGPAFWIFWGLVVLCILYGFMHRSAHPPRGTSS